MQLNLIYSVNSSKQLFQSNEISTQIFQREWKPIGSNEIEQNNEDIMKPNSMKLINGMIISQ